MVKLRQILFTLLSLGMLLLLSGCDMALLDPKGIVAADQKELLIVSVLLMLIIVVPTLILTFVFARKYRASNTKAKYTPDWGHSTRVEIVCWTVPCIIIAILAAITWVSSHKLDPYRPLNVSTKPITIQVIALPWRWLFVYPDQKIATLNFVQVPVNTPINFLVTSDAPMNSFQIPHLGGQIYAMSGMQTKLHLMANEVGDYTGFSANYSGAGFSDMKFVARASSQADFDKWVKSVKQSRKQLTMESYNELALPSEESGVQNFSQVPKDLFHNVIMKYMMPGVQHQNGTEATVEPKQPKVNSHA